MPSDTVYDPTSARAWKRDQDLRALGFENYGDYLASTAWYSVRQRYKNSDLPQDCLLCKTPDDIQLHHRTYERVGREKLEDLVPLCAACHTLVHSLERQGLIAGLDVENLEELVDAERARRNRGEQQRRTAKAKADFNSPTREQERAGQENARAVRHLRREVGRCATLGVDVSEVIHAAARQIETIGDAHARQRGRSEATAA